MAKKPLPEIETTDATYDHGPGPFIEGALPRSPDLTVLAPALLEDDISENPLIDVIHPVEIARGRSEVALYEGIASCASCRFMARDSANAMECRRYPPARGSGAGFPSPLNVRMWCGEYLEGART